MTIPQLITQRRESTPVNTLAMMSLRYEALRRMSGETYLALVRSVIAEHKSTHDYEMAFDELVDKVVLAHANEEARA